MYGILQPWQSQIATCERATYDALYACCRGITPNFAPNYCAKFLRKLRKYMCAAALFFFCGSYLSYRVIFFGPSTETKTWTRQLNRYPITSTHTVSAAFKQPPFRDQDNGNTQSRSTRGKSLHQSHHEKKEKRSRKSDGEESVQ